jgi:hypothetical protein
MRRSGKWLLAAAAVVLVLAALAVWYRAEFSMRAVRELEVNRSDARVRVLIATQGGDFKESVVSGVVAHLAPRQAYVRVTDVSHLPDIREQDWSAVIILHTWEMGKPPHGVAEFLRRTTDRRKIIALATSGDGRFKIDGIDAISTASRMADAPLRVAEINAKLDALLGPTVAVQTEP